MTTFAELGLSRHILNALAAEGFDTPTPIQAQAIPLALEGHDLVGLAQTGTGKTAAFGLPIIEKLMIDHKKPEPKAVKCLILAPTRELVNQIATNLRIFTRNSPIRIAIVVGGASIQKQMMEVGRGVDIVVATPGRLLDLVNRRAMTLTATRFLVLDEADQMLDLGFIHDLRRIVKMVPQRRQTMLFSATMPKAIAELAEEYLTSPKQVEVSVAGKAADKVQQYVHFVTGKDQKADLLRKSLADNPDGLALVFMRTKHTAEKLMKHLENIGFSVASIHGNKSQGQRDRALKGFRDGEIRVLVATDVAARGIDVPGVTHVYNYDLPEVSESYVHRIGRTARAGREGIAIAYCAPDEGRLLRDIEKLMGMGITVASGTAPADMARPAKSRGGRNGGTGGRGGEAREGAGGNRGRGGKPHRGQGPREDRTSSDERTVRPARPARPARDENARSETRRPARAEGEVRNSEFRGQRSGEAAPRGERPIDGVTAGRAPARTEYRSEHRTEHRKPERPAGSPSADGQKRTAGNHAGRPSGKPAEFRGPRPAAGKDGLRRRSGGGSRQG